MPRYTTVLFDLDGTLINTNDLIVTSFQHVFRTELGLEVPAEEIYPYFGEPLVRTMARYDEARAESLTAVYRAFNITKHDELVNQFPGIGEALHRLQAAGTGLGVVTSKYTDLARRGLRVCGLDAYFPVVVGVDQTDGHKPGPEPALRACELLGIQPGHQVLMVGDSVYDMACGQNAGLCTAAVGWTVNRDALSESRPDHWVESAADLVALVMGTQEAAG